MKLLQKLIQFQNYGKTNNNIYFFKRKILGFIMSVLDGYDKNSFRIIGALTLN